MELTCTALGGAVTPKLLLTIIAVPSDRFQFANPILKILKSLSSSIAEYTDQLVVSILDS